MAIQNPESRIQNATPLLCLVTDRRAAGGRLAALVLEAVQGGVNLVQVREKDLPALELLRLVEEVRQVVAGRALVVVNDRLDVALVAGADGGHLPADGVPTALARQLLGGRLVGRSVHSASEAAQAGRDGADYVVLGPIFPTRSHAGHPGAGVGLIQEVRARCSAPLVGIGGITPENTASVIGAGADGVAVISAILGAADPCEAAARLREALDRAWAERSYRIDAAGRGRPAIDGTRRGAATDAFADRQR